MRFLKSLIRTVAVAVFVICLYSFPMRDLNAGEPTRVGSPALLTTVGQI
jgi:hypothetical protein